MHDTIGNMSEDIAEAYVYKRLMSAMTLEQLVLFADLIERSRTRAIATRCGQSVTITFNKHGLPRRLRGTDNIFLERGNYVKEEERSAASTTTTTTAEGSRAVREKRRERKRAVQ